MAASHSMIHQDSATHDDVTNLMYSLGYSVNEGACRGIAMMGIQAFAIGQIQPFNERLQFIKHPDTVSKIKAYQAKVVAAHQNKIPVILNDDDKRIIDLLAFFDGIELYQNPANHPVYFETPLTQINADTLSNIAGSIELDKIGNLSRTHSWPGIYNDAELTNYFSYLDTVARTEKQAFSLLLGSDDHAIAIHFDPATQDWYVLDVNQPPIKRLPKNETLDHWVKEAFGEYGSITAFETSLYMPHAKKEMAEQIKNAISTTEFREIHAVTVDKAKQQNSNGATLAYFAAKNGHKDFIQVLGVAGANLNTPCEDGATPAFIAAYNGHANIIKALHVAGVDLNASMNNGATPAFIAAQNGHANVIEALHTAGADLNNPKNNGATPAFIAAQNGHANVIEILHAAGVDLNASMNNGITPAAIAAYKNQVHVLEILEKAGIDLTQKTPHGTPLQIATNNNATECIVFLQDYIARKTISNINTLTAARSSTLFGAASSAGSSSLSPSSSGSSHLPTASPSPRAT